MSDDFHRPTLTVPSGAYNATQVRLYGIQATGGFSFTGHPATLGDTGVSVHIGCDVEPPEPNPEGMFILKKNAGRPFSDVLADVIAGTIVFPIPTKLAYQLRIDMKDLGTIVISTSVSLGDVVESGPLSAGIIVAYSYEGHCFDLPKPKVMLIRATPNQIPRDDCGYDKKAGFVNGVYDPTVDSGYRVWIVDKLDQCVEFEMNQGFIEQLVLDANLPGKRSPNAYVGKMMLAHRSGRLSE
jgi:hypothetical protein